MSNNHEPASSDNQEPPEAPIALPVLGISQQAHRPLSSPPPLNPATPPLAKAFRDVARANALLEGAQQPVNRGAPHVLLVDDNPINLQLLVMFMKKCGFPYEEAENGQEAVDKYKMASVSGQSVTKAPTRGFDFILMDISMPIMNGLDATKHIRDYEFENGIPATTVIALTGLASADARRDAKDVGVDVFLPKPVRFAELRKLLQDR
jgi:CheY-like chemotaxis protein